MIAIKPLVVTTLATAYSAAMKVSLSEAKRLALKAALEDKSIRISEALAATFKLYDVMGAPIEERAQP